MGPPEGRSFLSPQKCQVCGSRAEYDRTHLSQTRFRMTMACRTVTTNYRTNQGTHERTSRDGREPLCPTRADRGAQQRLTKSLTRWLLHARVRHDHQAEEPESHHPKGLTPHYCGWAHRSSNGAQPNLQRR